MIGLKIFGGGPKSEINQIDILTKDRIVTSAWGENNQWIC